jgi:hypothetical protein
MGLSPRHADATSLWWSIMLWSAHPETSDGVFQTFSYSRPVARPTCGLVDQGISNRCEKLAGVRL